MSSDFVCRSFPLQFCIIRIMFNICMLKLLPGVDRLKRQQVSRASGKFYLFRLEYLLRSERKFAPSTKEIQV